LKAYYCPECSHRWFEPADNKHKSGWGCPNACASAGRVLSMNHTDIAVYTFEQMLTLEMKDEEKAKIRYHLNLLKQKEKYPVLG